MTSQQGSFTFRQRAGRLNWKLISSLDLNDIVIHVNIHELQQVLDSITFSEVVGDDIKNNTVDAVNKLIHVMQYTIEYLLNHQENQFALITKLNYKINQLKKSREQYYQQNLSFREDIKTYQRQLHLLRKSISHPNTLMTTTIQPYAKVVGGDDRKNSDQIVKTILDHERDLRKNMMDLLDDQRREFTREMSNIVEVLKKSQNQPIAPTPIHATEPTSVINTGIIMQNLQLQVEKVMQIALDSYKENILKFLPPMTRQEENFNKKAENILKESALESLDNQLREKSRDLKELENALRRREESLQVREKWPNGSDKAVKMRLGSKMLRVILIGVVRRMMNRGFRKWYGYVLDEKDKDRYENHGKMLLFAQEKQKEQQKHLEAQLIEEKSRQSELHANFVHAQSELEALQQRLRDIESQSTQKQRTIETMQDQLQREKDKYVVLSASFNAANANFNRDRQVLLDKIQLLETGKASTPPTIVKNPSLAHLPPEFLQPGLDEDALLKLAESELTRNQGKPRVHEMAKSLLAKQIVQNLSQQLNEHNHR